jgi:hypothetical protein
MLADKILVERQYCRANHAVEASFVNNALPSKVELLETTNCNKPDPTVSPRAMSKGYSA